VAAISAVLTAAACTVAGPATVNTAAVTQSSTAGARPATAGASPSATIKGCVVGAWAEDFTAAGRLSWQVSLGADPGLSNGELVQPLATGGVTVFADGDGLYALRLGNGHQLWHRVFAAAKNPAPGYVGDLIAWKGAVIALVGQGSATPKLVALNPATGAVRWTAMLGTEPLENISPVVTSDGVAAINVGTQGNTLAGIDLSTGRRLWSRTYLKTPLTQASGTALVVDVRTSFTAPVTLTGIGGRSGRTLWSRAGFPSWIAILSAPGGRVLVDGAHALPPAPGKKQTVYPVIALSARTGKTLWQLKTPEQAYAVWPTPAGVAIAAQLFGTTFTKPPAPQVYLADLATGKLRWSVALPEYANVDQSGPALVTASDVTVIVATADTGTVVDYSARSGAVRWRAVISAVTGQGRFLARPSGPDVVVTFPLPSASEASRLLALNAATGATKATNYLPFTSTVGTVPTVAGNNVLVEPVTASCAPPVHPEPLRPAATH
jgi:outer membrane protein assembly factor BamB